MSKPPMDGMAWHGMARPLLSTCWDKSSPEGQDDEVADWLAQNPEKSLMKSLTMTGNEDGNESSQTFKRVNNRMLRCRRVYYVRTLGKEGGQGGRGPDCGEYTVPSGGWATSCPSVPSTCLDLIYLTQLVRPPPRGTCDYCTRTHANSPFCRSIAPPKCLVLPQIPPQAKEGNLQSSQSTTRSLTANKHSILLLLLCLWSPPPAHSDPSLPSSSPPKRQTDISLPTRPPTQQPSTLLLHPPRRLPPQFANTYLYNPTPSGLHCNPLPRRPWTTGDVEQVSSTSHDDRQGPRQGQGQARDRDKALRHITVHRLKHDTDKHVHYCTVWPPPDCGIRPLPLRARSSDTAQSIPPPAPPSPRLPSQTIIILPATFSLLLGPETTSTPAASATKVIPRQDCSFIPFLTSPVYSHDAHRQPLTLPPS